MTTRVASARTAWNTIRRIMIINKYAFELYVELSPHSPDGAGAPAALRGSSMEAVLAAGSPLAAKMAATAAVVVI